MKKRISPHGLNIRSERLNNKGLTLIEIMVVMAIIAIASTMVWLSVNTIFGLQAKQTAKELYAGMEKTKVEQMMKSGETSLKLRRDDDDGGVYLDFCHDGEVVESKKIGSSRIIVTYTLTNSEGTLDSNGIVLAFNRSDGSFKTAEGTGGDYYDTITILSGGFSRTITLYPNTGKFEYAA